MQQVNFSSGCACRRLRLPGAIEAARHAAQRCDVMGSCSATSARVAPCAISISRRIIGRAGIIISTGETTPHYRRAVSANIRSWRRSFINEAFLRAGLVPEQAGLAAAFEIDKAVPDSFLMEVAQAAQWQVFSCTRSSGYRRPSTVWRHLLVAPRRRAFRSRGRDDGADDRALGMMTD